MPIISEDNIVESLNKAIIKNDVVQIEQILSNLLPVSNATLAKLSDLILENNLFYAMDLLLNQLKTKTDENNITLPYIKLNVILKELDLWILYFKNKNKNEDDLPEISNEKLLRISESIIENNHFSAMDLLLNQLKKDKDNSVLSFIMSKIIKQSLDKWVLYLINKNEAAYLYLLVLFMSDIDSKKILKLMASCHEQSLKNKENSRTLLLLEIMENVYLDIIKKALSSVEMRRSKDIIKLFLEHFCEHDFFDYYKQIINAGESFLNDNILKELYRKLIDKKNARFFYSAYKLKPFNSLNIFKYIISHHPQISISFLEEIISYSDFNLIFSNDTTPLKTETALSYAISEQVTNLDLLSFLLNHNQIDVNHQDEDGLTALHKIALLANKAYSISKLVPIIELFLNHPRVRLFIKDNKGKSAVERILQTKNKNLIEVVLKNKRFSQIMQENENFSTVEYLVNINSSPSLIVLLQEKTIDLPKILTTFQKIKVDREFLKKELYQANSEVFFRLMVRLYLAGVDISLASKRSPDELGHEIINFLLNNNHGKTMPDFNNSPTKISKTFEFLFNETDSFKLAKPTQKQREVLKFITAYLKKKVTLNVTLSEGKDKIYLKFNSEKINHTDLSNTQIETLFALKLVLNHVFEKKLSPRTALKGKPSTPVLEKSPIDFYKETKKIISKVSKELNIKIDLIERSDKSCLAYKFSITSDLEAFKRGVDANCLLCEAETPYILKLTPKGTLPQIESTLKQAFLNIPDSGKTEKKPLQISTLLYKINAKAQPNNEIKFKPTPPAITPDQICENISQLFYQYYAALKAIDINKHDYKIQIELNSNYHLVVKAANPLPKEYFELLADALSNAIGMNRKIKKACYQENIELRGKKKMDEVAEIHLSFSTDDFKWDPDMLENCLRKFGQIATEKGCLSDKRFIINEGTVLRKETFKAITSQKITYPFPEFATDSNISSEARAWILLQWIVLEKNEHPQLNALRNKLVHHFYLIEESKGHAEFLIFTKNLSQYNQLNYSGDCPLLPDSLYKNKWTYLDSLKQLSYYLSKLSELTNPQTPLQKLKGWDHRLNFIVFSIGELFFTPQHQSSKLSSEIGNQLEEALPTTHLKSFFKLLIQFRHSAAHPSGANIERNSNDFTQAILGEHRGDYYQLSLCLSGKVEALIEQFSARKKLSMN